MTALTTYFTTSSASTVTTDNKLVTTSGGGVTNKNSTLGKATKYGEIFSQGTTNAWYAGSSAPNPDDHGWLWDSTTLADNSASFSAGTWTATINLNLNTSSITADLYVRAYRRASNGTFYPIVTMSLTGQTITSTQTNFTLTGTTSSASATFQTGDLLYMDQIVNVKTNTVNSSTLVIKTNIANSSTQGNTESQVVTPGYITISSSTNDAMMRYRMSGSAIYDAMMRLRTIPAASSVVRDARMRMRLSGSNKKDALMRLRTQALSFARYDASLRFKAASQPTSYSATMRFRLSPYAHLALFPTATRRTGVFPTATRRQTV